jgi:hypothetical protein
VLGEVEFILSKNHGLLQFIPFTYFFVEIPVEEAADAFPFASYKLMGFQSEQEMKGFKKPGFSEYFHLSAGDQLLWKDTYYDITDLTSNYYKDSLLSSFTYNDSVVYELLREVYDSSGQYIRSENITTTYSRLRYEYLLKTPARWYATDDEVNHGEIYFIKDMKLEFTDDDTIYHKEFIADGCFFDQTVNECLVSCIEALFQTEYKVSSREGLTYYSGFYGSELELFGSIIDGKLSGSMEIPPVGIEQTSVNPIHIFPNPSSGLIHFTSDLEIHRVEIYNCMGINVYTNDAIDEIDLSDQAPGFYLLIVCTKSGERYMQSVSIN